MFDFISSVDPKILITIGILLRITILCLAVLAVKLLWKWIIPDLFPGAVSQGIMTNKISYKTAIKVTIAAFILVSLFKPSSLFTYTYTDKNGTNSPPIALIK